MPTTRVRFLLADQSLYTAGKKAHQADGLFFCSKEVQGIVRFSFGLNLLVDFKCKSRLNFGFEVHCLEYAVHHSAVFL